MNRDKQIRRVLWLVLFLNVLVAAAKLLYGHLTGSLSMWADGLHSSFDGASNIIGIIGIWAASLPPDESHPYIDNFFKFFFDKTLHAMDQFMCCIGGHIRRDIDMKVHIDMIHAPSSPDSMTVLDSRNVHGKLPDEPGINSG